jgi:hypothetical protein
MLAIRRMKSSTLTEKHKMKPIGCGMTVHFKSKVFQEPYAPFYDAYKGHTFRIINIHEGDHCELVCISDTSVIVAGNVHKDELKQT